MTRRTPPDRQPEDHALGPLMERYQAGDMRALESLYAHFRDPLLRFFRSLMPDAARSQDLLQETFLQLHRSRRTYRPGAPVTPWVFGIARHVHLMEHRRTSRRAIFERPSSVEHPDPTSESEASRILASRSVSRALDQLPPRNREVVVLRYLFDLRFREIGEALGMGEAAARVRVSRSLAAMRQWLRATGRGEA
jgi:RNA polymerase sigma-70 factor (ECF subfamily)